MSRTPLDILNLFVEAPGDLLIFFLVIALSLGSLFLAIGHRSRFPFEHSTRRFVIASAGLVVVWLVMLGAAFLSQYSDLDANTYMPPLERLAYSITLVMLAWSFLSADFIRWQNRSNLLVLAASFILALLYLNTSRSWLSMYSEGLAFNSTEFAPLWSGVTASIAFVGLLLTVINVRHIVDAPLKVLFFLLFALGNGWDLYQFSQAEVAGNYLGAARLAYAGGLVLLPLIIYRLAVALLENSLVEVVQAASQPNPAVVQASTSAEASAGEGVDALLAAPSSWNFGAAPAPSDRRHILNAIGVMMDTRENASIPEQIVKGSLEALQVELCALLLVQENNYADVIAGHDLVAEVSLSGISLNLNEQPTILDAANRVEQAILFPEYQQDELEDLFRRLSIASLSAVYVQPMTIQGDLVALMLVAMPYRQAELSPEEMESLRDIGFVAGHVLAWSLKSEASTSLADERAIEEIEAKHSDIAVDQDSVVSNRRELETSLERVTERIGRLRLQIAELKQQLQEQYIRLLDAVASGDNGNDAVQRLSATFDEQANLRDSCEMSARELLDAETILRILNVPSGETLAQVIREYLHKEYNVLLTARDRLRRQINTVLVMGRSAATDGYAAILQSLADESAQLDLEREQQQRRLDSIVSKLESMGVESGHSSLTQALIQLYAERMALTQFLTDANQDRKLLLSERQKLMDTNGGDRDELEQKLKHLTADHEQLLNSREEMRREQQELLAQIADAHKERDTLAATKDELEADLSAQDSRQEAIDQQISDLVEERDNLLQIRDQLTAKVTASLASSAGSTLDSDMNGEITELRETIQRLAGQREQLALELSDARMELSSARGAHPEHESDLSEDTEEYALNVPELFAGMLQDMRTPMTSIFDYTGLLLEESIGILGAAQLQVLKLIAADVNRLTEHIAEIQKVAKLDAAQFSLEHSNVDVVSIIEDVIQETAHDISEKGILIELSLADQMPPANVDGASLKHILSQLILNASIVSPAGALITVTASAGRFLLPNGTDEIDALEISVHDKGGGIHANDVQRVFARKYRADNPNIAGFGDSGVGMTVARAFARAHDGDLWVTSEAGEGSIFHLAFPLQLAASIEE